MGSSLLRTVRTRTVQTHSVSRTRLRSRDRRRALAPLLFAAVLCIALPDAQAAEVTLPVDVGVGPAFYHGTGPVFDGVTGHFGIKLSLAAIIDRALIRKHIKRVPKQYRKMALGMNEVRYRPSIFMPDSLLISPKVGSTGMYGVTWRPFGLSIPLSQGAVNADIGLGVILTYAFIHSDNAAFAPTSGIMHFLRPGLDIGPRVEIPVTDNFLVSFGWSALLYVPQKVGDQVFAIPTFDEAGLQNSLWFMGQLWLKLHFRFPYTTHI
ncbi:MAG: hypothetical protein KC502_11655 [Myxococcales bacterium]|nr:hypothetical protein [Myxococcales bacterium]